MEDANKELAAEQDRESSITFPVNAEDAGIHRGGGEQSPVPSVHAPSKEAEGSLRGRQSRYDNFNNRVLISPNERPSRQRVRMTRSPSGESMRQHYSGGESVRQRYSGGESVRQHHSGGESIRQHHSNGESQRQRSKSISLRRYSRSKPFKRLSRSRSRSRLNDKRRTQRRLREDSRLKRHTRSTSSQRMSRSRSRSRLDDKERRARRRSRDYRQEHSSRNAKHFKERSQTRSTCDRNKRRLHSSESDEHYYYVSKRKRSLHRSPRDSYYRCKSPLEHSSKFCNNSVNDSKETHTILDKFLNILKDMKGQSSPNLSHSNVVPEFDPMSKDQTVLTWITKVEECAEIYGWKEKEIIHFALPKLTGIAKTWYRGLDTVLYTWNEWKKLLLENFPCREDYAELLTIMLAKKARYGESLENYYYDKMNLINRCGIKGRKAVDCILNGIDDRAVRVGAQAAQFREPEQALMYLKTVRIGSSRDIGDKSKQDKRVISTTSSNKRLDTNKKIVCHNCNEEGHKSFKCQKPPTKCTTCGKLGHMSIVCRSGKYTQDANQKPSLTTAKDEKQVSELNFLEGSNSKYVFDILVNNKNLLCHVDLGSQCTLIRENEAKKLNLLINTDNLPLMRAIGGHHVKPLGKSRVDVTVQSIKENIEVLVVEDHVLKYPVLLGHTFTELPRITIIKTPDKLIFERNTCNKLFLLVEEKVILKPHEINTIPVVSSNNFEGSVYVNGSMRGGVNQEHFLLSGEYTFKAGSGLVVVVNMCDYDIIFNEGMLLTRALPIISSIDTFSVTFDNTHLDNSINCGPNIPSEQRKQLQNLLSKYNDCFLSGLKDLGLTAVGEMVIELENTEPVAYRPYRMSLSERNLVREMVGEMLDAGIIRESSSPYASPIVLVKKKTGEKRLCVDYRALNKRTKKDHFPLPRVEDQLDQLAGNKFFILLDLASGYYQIPISKSSQDKTAFITPDGQYEYLRVPFGLVNAPSVFQRTINKILLEAKVKYALVYMDDILIPARSFQEGMARLEEVLTLLRKGGLTLKLAKCNFFFEEIDFLGFEVSASGIKPGMRKTEAVGKFPTPKSQHELRQFIGLASFFRRFVRGFAVICKPLTDLLKKDCPWKWATEQEEAFHKIKEILVSRPILTLYDPKRETQLHTDASKHGVAGILLQKSDEGLFKPISYFSRKTTPDEQRLHSFELETLAVIASLNRFRVYLLGVPFKIFTDCNALRTTLTKRDLIPRIARWWIQLTEFDCEIEYRPGTSMAHADALSRNPVGEAIAEEHCILDVLETESEDWITTVQSSDEEVARIKQILSDPNSDEVINVITHFKLKDGKVYRLVGPEGEKSMRWVVPKGVRWQIAKMNHDDIGHFGFEKTLHRIQQSYWFPKMRRFIKKYVRSCLECAHHKGTNGKQQGELHPIKKPEIPFHTIHADHLGPFVRSKRGNVYLLVIIDGFTKFINIKPVKNTKSSTSIRILREHISFFGTPVRLITDQGSSFTSNSFRSFVKSQGIKHILNAVATPRANGQVERFNRTILDALSTKCHGKDDKCWDDYVPDVQIGLNTTLHKTTGKSPSELLFGIRLKSSTENVLSEIIDEVVDVIPLEDLDEARRKAGARISDQQLKDKLNFDSKRVTNVSFSIGDLVSIKRDTPSDGKSKKLVVKYQGPYRVAKVLPNDRYLIEDTPLTRKKGKRRYENIIAIDKIKPWLSFDKNFASSESEIDSALDE